MLRRCGRFVAVTSSALLSLCASAPAQSNGAPGGKAPPKLVLFLVIDGFPQDQLVKYYDLYGDRGFKLLLDKGGWYGNNHYSHATTYTSVGHATLLSCAHPYKHGVVGNDWIDKKTGKRLIPPKTQGSNISTRKLLSTPALRPSTSKSPRSATN